MTNATEKDPLTPGATQAEEGLPQTDSQLKGETQPVEETKTENEPPAGTKSWEHALQLSREREKRVASEREQERQRAEEMEKRIQELELSDLDESERYKIESETAKQEVETLKQQLELEKAKKEYRRRLVEKEKEYPKTVAHLRKQMEKDYYPFSFQSWEEFETNLADYAEDYEGTPAATGTPKTPSSSPAYTPPEEVDINKLSAKDLKKLLPLADKQ